MRIEPYHSGLEGDWRRFVDNAKNSTFLFYRNYMDYHADRFQDASLMCYDGNSLVACLPANIKEDTAFSHGGLTYGGFITDRHMKVEKMMQLFDAACAHFRGQGAKQFIYKPIPHIYHLAPAEEDLYALFRCGARLIARNISSAQYEGRRVTYSKGRKACVKKGRNSGLKVVEANTAEAIMPMVAKWLDARHDTYPAHNGAEMELLRSRFPNNIRVFTAVDAAGAVLAAAIMYESARVAHCQYLVVSDEGKPLCALDFLTAYLLEEVYADKPCFDWGISSVDNGNTLQDGLLLNKESFGGRAICYDIYQITL